MSRAMARRRAGCPRRPADRGRHGGGSLGRRVLPAGDPRGPEIQCEVVNLPRALATGVHEQEVAGQIKEANGIPTALQELVVQGLALVQGRHRGPLHCPPLPALHHQTQLGRDLPHHLDVRGRITPSPCPPDMEPPHGLPLDVQAHREDGGQRAPLQPGVHHRERRAVITG